MTPQKVYDKGDYRRAIKMATSDVLRNKDVAANKAIIKRAVRQVANARVEQHDDIMGRDVGVWKNSQRQYYRDLELLGRVHKSGVVDILPAYDAICDRKMELDHAVIDYYYWAADSLLTHAYETGHKSSARNAYQHLQQCHRASGDLHYDDISILKEEAVDRGTVYFIAHGLSPSTSLFLQPLPQEGDIQPDCSVSVSVGSRHSDHTTSTSTDTYTKEVVDRMETYLDTAGVVHRREIMKEISGSVIVVTHELTVSQAVNIYVDDLTGHCTMHSSWETITRSETLEEVSISGDRDAIPSHISTNSVHPYAELHSLESEVSSDVDSWISSY